MAWERPQPRDTRRRGFTENCHSHSRLAAQNGVLRPRVATVQLVMSANGMLNPWMVGTAISAFLAVPKTLCKHN